MKYILFTLFIIGGLLITSGVRLTKKGTEDKRYKKRSILPYLLGLLCWGIMLAIAILTDFQP